MSAALALPEPAEPLSIGVATLLPDGRLDGPRGFILLEERWASLLRRLASSAGQVVSRADLEVAVGNAPVPVNAGCPKRQPLDFGVGLLRSAFAILGNERVSIREVEGIGYALKFRVR